MSLDMEVGLGPGDFVLDGDPVPPQKRAQPPNFRLMSIVAKQLDGSRRYFGMEAGFGQGYIVLSENTFRRLLKTYLFALY